MQAQINANQLFGAYNLFG